MSTGYVCGQINAKNAMGGYTGFKRYASTQHSFIIEDSGAASLGANEKTTQQIIEALARQNGFMKTQGRPPTQEELHALEFEAEWKRLCS